MSHFTAAEVPDVIVKPGKMLGLWTPRLKMLMLVVGIAVYAYLLLLLKTLYLKDQRLDRIAAMAADTENMIENLKNMDTKLSYDLQRMHSALHQR